MQIGNYTAILYFSSANLIKWQWLCYGSIGKMILVGKQFKIESIEAKTFLTEYFNQADAPAYGAGIISRCVFIRLFF